MSGQRERGLEGGSQYYLIPEKFCVCVCVWLGVGGKCDWVGTVLKE